MLGRRKGKQSVRRSGPAEASEGGVAVTGVVMGDVFAGARRQVPPSDYVHQIRRIAAPELLDREAELAELGAFCIAEDGPAYGWWRAPAWTGKSALMAAFALAPPRGVQVVAFFVTARFAGQSDRSAFCEVVMRQLCTLLDQEVPPLTDATRDAALLHALEAAGAACMARGERLVLLVDGLDEDRGTTTEEGGFSIAALLPTEPPPGVRVIVAGRPDPPMPRDVPDSHPLRQGHGIVRSLSPSAHAREIRRLAENELRHIVHDKGLALHLVGLISAARGGLSGDDLAELAYCLPADAEEHLRTVTGRSFSGRDPQWASDGAPTVYILAHDELQVAAEKMIGPRELEGFRQRLHAWADGYQTAGWPARTPEYLMRGYPRMLLATGDLTRATSLALDQRRHVRAVEISGSNMTVLEEIAAAIEAHLAQGSWADLDALLRLAYVREELRNRAFRMPRELAVCWALLDEPDRAHALIISGNGHIPENEALTYVLLATALGKAGRVEQALAFASDAVDTARTLDDPANRAETLAEAAHALGEIGLPAPAVVDAEEAAAVAEKAIAVAEEAAATARTVAPTGRRDQVLADVAEAMGRMGESTRAIELSDAIADPEDWAEALVRVACALGEAGRYADATEIIRNAPLFQAEALTVVARSLTEAGRHSEAVALAEEALAHASAHDGDVEDPEEVVAEVVGVLAAAGQHNEAAELAATLDDSAHADQALTHLAEALARAGHRDWAVAVAQALTDGSAQEALVAVAGALAATGRHTQAAELAATLDDSAHANQAHARLAEALARAGHYHRAVAVASRITTLGFRAKTEAQMGCAFAEAGRSQQAVELAMASAATAQGTAPLLLPGMADGAVIAVALARAGRHAEALEAVGEVAESWQAANVLAAVADALADAGQLDQAARVARRISTDKTRVRTLTHVADCSWRAGHPARADELAEEAADIARKLARETGDPVALADVAGLLAAMGRQRQADRMAHAAVWTARRVDDLVRGPSALADAVRALAVTGRPAQARKLALGIADLNGRSSALYHLAEQLAREGNHQQAITLAESITLPEYRRFALTEIAGQLARAGHHEQAVALARGERDVRAMADVGSVVGDRTLVAEAIQAGSWEGSVEAVGRLSADDFDAFAGWLAQRR